MATLQFMSDRGEVMEVLPISVIVCAKNAESTIEECLTSVQRNNPAEIIVVDGNSTDRTIEIAKRYTERVYFDGGKGFNYAQQLGVEQATQEYIAYVDGDIVLPEGTLVTLLAELKASDRVSMQAKLLAANLSTYWERATDWHIRLRQAGRCIGLSAAVLRRDTVLKYKLDAQVKVASDLALELMVKRDGGRLGISSASVYHHHRANLKSLTRQRFRFGREITQFISKYGPWHPGFWPPLVLLYRLGFCLIKGKPNFIPYFVVVGVVETAGMVKGFFELLGESRKKSGVRKMPFQKDGEVLRSRWLIALEKEKEYNAKKEDIEERIIDRRITWARLLDLLKSEITFDNSKRVLDIGAEATSIFLALREGEKYAVDPLFDYLFELHPSLKEIEEYRDVNFISSPLEDMAVDKGFDIIFMVAALNHIGKLKPFIDKIDKLLLPSGILIAVVECYADPVVRNIISFFDGNLYHPHHFTVEDVMRLFSNYSLIKREQIEEMYADCPSERGKPKMKLYRIDRRVARLWQLLGEWGKRRDILFTLKVYLCYSLVFLIRLLKRQGPAHENRQLFVFQKQ